MLLFSIQSSSELMQVDVTLDYQEIWHLNEDTINWLPIRDNKMTNDFPDKIELTNQCHLSSPKCPNCDLCKVQGWQSNYWGACEIAHNCGESANSIQNKDIIIF